MTDNPFKALLEDGVNPKGKDVPVTMISASGRYRIGPPTRPNIVHDNGHLVLPAREPNAADRAVLAMWVSALELAEATRPDLPDATAAYRHFLYGKGVDRHIDYERFIANDPRGTEFLAKLINDFAVHAEAIGENRQKFSVTSEPYKIGVGAFVPPPSTNNWLKALGEHYVWVYGDVSIEINNKSEIVYSASLVLNAEDRYNFNPGQSDVETGIPDSFNGRLEVCRLAHQYMNYGKISRAIKWKKGHHLDVEVSGESEDRSRRPSDNRRLRNKL